MKYHVYACSGCGKTLTNSATKINKNHFVFDGKIRLESRDEETNERTWTYLTNAPVERIFVCSADCLNEFLQRRIAQDRDQHMTMLRDEATQADVRRLAGGGSR